MISFPEALVAAVISSVAITFVIMVGLRLVDGTSFFKKEK